MRGFVVVLGFFAVALARPEGYNYASPIVNSPFYPQFGNYFDGQNSLFSSNLNLQHAHSFGQPSSFDYSSALLHPAAHNLALLNSASLNPASLNSALFNPASLSSASLSSTSLNPASLNTASLNSASLTPTVVNNGNAGALSQEFEASTGAPPVQHAPIITKHFHSFVAPEESDHEVQEETINLGRPHKHYRVIFIKAPHHSSHKTALKIAQAANEEKTIIYVLSKKPDVAEIHTAIKEAHSVPSKPEVYFIKYKTPEEAEHAQHVIKSKYEVLGGSTSVSNEGIAPITSVVGSLGPVERSGSSSNLSPVLPTTNTVAPLPEPAPSPVLAPSTTLPQQQSGPKYLR